MNRSAAEKMVRQLLPVFGAILEIGPGKGVLTELLLKYRKDNRIVAVELDPALCDKLAARFGKDVEVINRSILEIQLARISAGQAVNLVGSLPYFISGEIIDWVISQAEKIDKGLFLLQKEFVDKLMLRGKANARGLMFQHLFDCQKLFDVRPGSFSPRPKVHSSVILFKKREERQKEDETIAAHRFYSFLQECFKNKRKTVFNQLAGKYPKETLGRVFKALAIDEKARAERLTLHDFQGLYLYILKEIL